MTDFLHKADLVDIQRAVEVDAVARTFSSPREAVQEELKSVEGELENQIRLLKFHESLVNGEEGLRNDAWADAHKTLALLIAAIETVRATQHEVMDEMIGRDTRIAAMTCSEWAIVFIAFVFCATPILQNRDKVDAAGNATRVGRRRGDDGKLVRYSKKTNEELK